MAARNRSSNDLFDRDMQRETHFIDVDELDIFIQINLLKLIPEQRIIAYGRIMHAITSRSGRLYFLEAPRVQAKRFLFHLFWKP